MAQNSDDVIQLARELLVAYANRSRETLLNPEQVDALFLMAKRFYELVEMELSA